MLKCLDQVRCGLLSPQTFQKAEVTRRSLNFTLSSVAVVEPSFTAAVFSIDVDSTGRYILSGAADGSWYIHDSFNLSGKIDHQKNCMLQCPRRVCHTRAISTVEWHPGNEGTDNGVFVTSSNDGKLCIWDANNSSKPVEEYEFEEAVNRHQINPFEGTKIAVCQDGIVQMIDVRTGTSIQKLPETLTKLRELRWNPRNQHQLIVGSDEGHLIEWDVRSTLNYRGYGLLEVRVARRGVRTRDFREQVSLLQKAHDKGIASIRYDSSGLEFYTMGDEGNVRRWATDLNPSKEPLICTVKYGKKPKSQGNYQIGIAADTDPPLIFAPKGTSISVCDMKDCVVRKELIGHFKNVNCFAYDPRYQQGYSGGNDSAVMIWSGHLTTEQTYQKEKPAPSYADSKQRNARTAGAESLINILDDDENEMEEYEPADTSSDEEFDI